MHEDFNACCWLLDRQVSAGRGDRTAIRCRQRAYTYGDVLDLVERAATGLRARGLRPEERVGVVLLDSVELVVVFLAAMRIGAVPVLTNPMLPGRDIGVILDDARARLVVLSGERSQVVDDLRAAAPEVEQVVTTGGGSSAGGWDELVAEGGDGGPHRTWAESPGVWLCTSGTTGRPKLAMHRHEDLRTTARTYGAHVLGISERDRCYSVAPLFHAYGLGNSLTFPFSVGAEAVLEPTRPPTPRLVADLVRRERPSLFFCIPTFYAALTNADLPGDTFSSVRLAVSAAEPLPAETFDRFRSRYGVTILDGLGSTELLHIFLSNTAERCRPGTSGVPVPGYEVRVVDDEGRDRPPGEPGQLLVRGESAATGYWCQSAASRATFEGAWIRTGDLYARSQDGYHTYLGRVDDMLRVGGEWVSPAEVEAVLIGHPRVLEAAVVGERDADGIMRPVAYVTPVGGGEPVAGELAEWCRERLAGYKRPRRFELVAELPKTATGKIQRYKLRHGPTSTPRSPGAAT